MIKSVLLAALLAFHAGVFAVDAGPYTAREALTLQARRGDADSGWALAWLYYGEGRLPQAWQAAQGLSAEGRPERAHLKAWLQASQGDWLASLATIEAEHCVSSECEGLAGAIAVKLGRMDQAANAYVTAFERQRGARELVLALTACLAAGEFARFDGLSAAADWRNDPAFAPATARIAELLKDRDLLGGAAK